MTRELAREVGRTPLAIRRHLVERTRFGEQILERDATRGISAGGAHRQLDLDLAWSSCVAVFTHVREGGAREDSRAVKVDEALDTKPLVRLAVNPEEIVDRH